MAGDLIASYLEELENAARRFGLDPKRLVEEIADHLAEASVLDGTERAIQRFGTAREIVAAVARAKGREMRIYLRRITTLVAILAAASAIASHILPSQSIDGTSFEAVVLASLGAMGVAAVGIALTAKRVWFLSLPIAGYFAAVTYSVWLSPSEGYIGGPPLSMKNGWAVAALIGVGCVAAIVARIAHIRPALGVGLVATGLFHIAITAYWQPVGGFGDGSVNLGIWALALGWTLIAASQFAGRAGAALALRASGRLLEHAGKRLANAGNRVRTSRVLESAVGGPAPSR